MESGFGHDFGEVRLHTGSGAARSAASVGARAYSFGNDIVFGASQYTPSTRDGQRLLAHELAHVQQRRTGAAPTTGLVQRAIDIVDSHFVGPLSATQRRAAVSCPIDCCHASLGTLHSMPLFFQQGRSAIVPEGSPLATGIGSELHFIAAGTQPAAGELCHCDDFHMIQVINTTHPYPPRTEHTYVDNDRTNTPFYGAPAGPFLAGHGSHAIPAGFVDAGQQVTTTESIYDMPGRLVSALGSTSLSWSAETCVACVKNTGPDRILGCTTYGFTQNYNASTSGFDPVQQIAPACRARASANFIATLSTDPHTTSYSFERAPGFIECDQPGDYVAPKGDTRIA